MNFSQINDAQLSHYWSMGASNGHLSPFNMILVIFDSFLASCYDKISLIILSINFSNLTSSISPKSPGCFQCKVVFKDQSLGTRGAYSYRVGQFLVLFSAQSQELHFLKDEMHQELLLIHPIKSRTMGILLILIDLPFGLFVFPTPKKKKTPSIQISLLICLISVYPTREYIFGQLLGFKLLGIISLYVVMIPTQQRVKFICFIWLLLLGGLLIDLILL